MRIVTYEGQPPSTLGAPDVAKLVDLFSQQNEVLKVALTTIVVVPEGTALRDATPREARPGRDDPSQA